MRAQTTNAAGSEVTSERFGYAYDASQNLRWRTNNTSVTGFTNNALNQLTSLNATTRTHDRRGNLISNVQSGETLLYSWDDENQLTSVRVDPASSPAFQPWRIDFVYDGLRRLRRTLQFTWNGSAWTSQGEVRYLYDGMLIVQERSSANTPQVHYSRGLDLSGTIHGAGGIGGLLMRSHGYSAGNWSSHNAYHSDANGNVTALVNSSGVLQALYKYNPYGGLISSSGTLASANTMRFSSKPAIFSSSGAWGFYYYGYRFYDPVNQRWLNRDPLGERGGLNLFVAIGNMPLGRVDTFGMTIFLSDRIQGADREKLLEVMERLARTEVGNCLLQLASDPWMRLAIITNQESPGEPGTAGGGLWSGPPELWDAMVSLEIEDPHYVDAPTRDSLLQHPGIASDQFPIRGSDEISGAAIILGHELGHAILDLNDEDWRTSDYDKENNVAWVENPIRCELGFPRRESYGYSWVAPFAHPHLRIAARY